MKLSTLLLAAFFLIASYAEVRSEVKVTATKGTTMVRHGVKDEWTPLSSGIVLKPEDSMRSGKNSSITIVIDGNRKLVIPELVIVDVSDIRTLTQEELLLKLAMEDVRSAPNFREGNGSIPRTTTMHGTNKNDATEKASAQPTEATALQLNGTKVLYDNGFYASCILRAKEVFRRDPSLQKKIDARLRVAAALERMNLKREALAEYRKLSEESLNERERVTVENKIRELKGTEG